MKYVRSGESLCPGRVLSRVAQPRRVRMLALQVTRKLCILVTHDRVHHGMRISNVARGGSLLRGVDCRGRFGRRSERPLRRQRHPRCERLHLRVAAYVGHDGQVQRQHQRRVATCCRHRTRIGRRVLLATVCAVEFGCVCSSGVWKVSPPPSHPRVRCIHMARVQCGR